MPKAGHILEMAGKNKYELPNKKKWQVKFYRIYLISFAYHNLYILDHLVDQIRLYLKCKSKITVVK